jgi:hypothetical protein
VTKKLGKRSAGVILLVVLAILAGGSSAASATPGHGYGNSGFGFEASWVEE